MDEYAKEQLQEARGVLSDADALHRGGEETNPLSISYIMLVHAAQAVLHTRGFDPTMHGGVVRGFSRELVENGPATRDDGQFLNNLQDERKAADYSYDYDSLGIDIEERFARTETFVSDMGTLAKLE